MSREIKFRVWCKEFDNRGISVGMNSNEELWDQWICDLNKDDNYEVMQYTGLKDKNGVEIYEGDIVKDEYGSYEVKYNLEAIGYVPFVYSGGGEAHPFTCEVIGNIYETPELLEK